MQRRSTRRAITTRVSICDFDSRSILTSVCVSRAISECRKWPRQRRNEATLVCEDLRADEGVVRSIPRRTNTHIVACTFECRADLEHTQGVQARARPCRYAPRRPARLRSGALLFFGSARERQRQKSAIAHTLLEVAPILVIFRRTVPRLRASTRSL